MQTNLLVRIPVRKNLTKKKANFLNLSKQITVRTKHSLFYKMNKTDITTILNAINKIANEVNQQKQQVGELMQKMEQQQNENAEAFRRVFELLESSRTQEAIIAPTSIGLPRPDKVDKEAIIDALPFCVTEPVEDYRVLYDQVRSLVSRKVLDFVTKTFSSKPPSWRNLLQNFKTDLVTTCKKRALRLKVDFNVCDDDWCLKYIIRTCYGNKRIYQRRTKAKLAAKKALKQNASER